MREWLKDFGSFLLLGVGCLSTLIAVVVGISFKYLFKRHLHEYLERHPTASTVVTVAGLILLVFSIGYLVQMRVRHGGVEAPDESTDD